MLLHRAQLRQQGDCEFVPAHKTKKARKSFERIGIGRQCVGLLVGHHLQPMLDAAQKFVRRCQLVARRAIDPAAGSERIKRRDGLAAAQRGVAAAGDELLGLHEELDLANAAAAELDVVSLDAISPWPR